MKRLFLCMVLSLILVSTTVLAASPSFSTCDEFMSSYQVLGVTVLDNVPFKNEVLHIYQDDEAFGFIQLADGVVIGADCEIQEEPTLIITLHDESVLSDLVSTDDFLTVYTQAKAEKRLTVAGVSFGSKLKVFAINTGFTVAHWFN